MPSHRKLNVDKPEDLALLVRSGVIWNTPHAQRGIDAIASGLVEPTECLNMPAAIRELLEDRTG